MLLHAVSSIRRVSLLGVLVGALAVSPAGAGAPLTMRVYPQISFEPATVRIQAIVERNSENRALEITAESEDFFRSSAVQLDGDESPSVSVFEFRELPAGSYEVRGVLLGRNGRPRGLAAKQIVVAGRPVGR
jgi:hypothetical protein